MDNDLQPVVRWGALSPGPKEAGPTQDRSSEMPSLVGGATAPATH